MTKDQYNQPAEGAQNWDDPLNENFADLGVEVANEVATWGDLPAQSNVSKSSDGQWPVYRVAADNVFVKVTDSSTEIVGGRGSSDHPIPEFHTEEIDIGQLVAALDAAGYDITGVGDFEGDRVSINNYLTTARKSSGQSLSGSTETKVEWELAPTTELGFDLQNNQWDVPTDGKYQVQSHVLVTGLSDGGQLKINIRKNGSKAYQSSVSSAANDTTALVTKTMSLVAGDTIDITATASESCTLPKYEQWTYFTVTREA